MLRIGASKAKNRPSGPDVGQTTIRKEPTWALRQALGRFEGRLRCFPGSSPAKIRPGSDLCNGLTVCLASYWPRPWNDFGVPLGARRLPKGGPEISKRQPPDDPNRFLGVPLGCLRGPGLPRGAGGRKETTRATQTGPPAAEERSFLTFDEPILVKRGCWANAHHDVRLSFHKNHQKHTLF